MSVSVSEPVPMSVSTHMDDLIEAYNTEMYVDKVFLLTYAPAGLAGPVRALACVRQHGEGDWAPFHTIWHCLARNWSRIDDLGRRVIGSALWELGGGESAGGPLPVDVQCVSWLRASSGLRVVLGGEALFLSAATLDDFMRPDRLDGFPDLPETRLRTAEYTLQWHLAAYMVDAELGGARSTTVHEGVGFVYASESGNIEPLSVCVHHDGFRGAMRSLLHNWRRVNNMSNEAIDIAVPAYLCRVMGYPVFTDRLEGGEIELSEDGSTVEISVVDSPDAAADFEDEDEEDEDEDEDEEDEDEDEDEVEVVDMVVSDDDEVLYEVHEVNGANVVVVVQADGVVVQQDNDPAGVAQPVHPMSMTRRQLNEAYQELLDEEADDDDTLTFAVAFDELFDALTAVQQFDIVRPISAFPICHC